MTASIGSENKRSIHPEIHGSNNFEQDFKYVIDQYAFKRSAIWRGHMPATARFIYEDTLLAQDNSQNILRADRYQSTTKPDEYFYYVYQSVIARPDTVMTYILSSSHDPVEQKKDQIGRYGTYSPKISNLTGSDPIPVIDSYRGSCQVITVDELIKLFPDMEAHLRNEVNTYYSTYRMATYLYDRTIVMKNVDGQDLKVKVFLNVGDQQKYVAEVMPVDENGGVNCFAGLRFEETNDSWYALSHHLHGPTAPPVIDEEGKNYKIDPSPFSGISMAGGGPGVIWIVGIPKDKPNNTYYSDEANQSQGEGAGYLFTMSEDSTPDDVLREIKRRGLSSLLPAGYQ